MKKQRLPNLVTIAILTVITVVFWIGLDLYRALTTKPTPPVAPGILAPLTPTLDQEGLDKLQQRVYKQTTGTQTTQLRVAEGVEVEETPEATIIPFTLATPSPSLTPSPTSTATASASPLP